MDERIELLSRYNLWGDAPFDFGFERKEYTDTLRDWTGNRLVKVVTGQRRTGKSYILRQMARELTSRGVPKENILFVNMEMTDLDFIKGYRDLDEVVKLYKREIGPQGKVYIFADEIQMVEGWERTVNALSQDYTAEYELFISGSNSKMLSGELATLLSGRYVQVPVYPFAYAEYLRFTGKERGKQSYLDYMAHGGLPELFALPEKTEVRSGYLSALKDTILLRDIIQRHAIRLPRLLEDLFAFFVNNASNPISANSIVKYLKSAGRTVGYDVVASYMGYIEDTFLVHRCERYDMRGKEVLAGTAKFYMNDLAYKRYLYPGYGGGIGYEVENAVYLELRRMGYEVYTGNIRGKEVDFVAQKAGETVYVQCAYLMADERTVEREYGALEAIDDNFPKIVVSLDDVAFPSRRGIRHAQAWRLREAVEGGGA